MASDTLPKQNKQGQAREKVVLEPGFHLTNWLHLMKTPGVDFSGRNGQAPRIITKEELALHNTKYDCWTSYKGKVYNISNYIPYHPGGEPKILMGAGKDCTSLFNKYHPWVNIESMLSKCYVGKLVTPEEKQVIADGKVESHNTPASSSDGAVASSSSAASTPSITSDDHTKIDTTIDQVTRKIEAQKLLDSEDDT